MLPFINKYISSKAKRAPLNFSLKKLTFKEIKKNKFLIFSIEKISHPLISRYLLKFNFLSEFRWPIVQYLTQGIIRGVGGGV